MKNLKSLLGRLIVAAVLLLPTNWVNAASLVLDDFSSPSIAVTGTPTGTGSQFFERTFDTFAGVSSQVREVNYNLYSDPSSSGVNVSVGGGAASVQAGTGALGEYIFAYGAFTRPVSPSIGGPLMNLDISMFNNLGVEFSSVGEALNINVVLYTATPYLLADGVTPLYYLQSGLNSGPIISGGPMVTNLSLTDNVVSAPSAPYFNFSQVDGVVLLIDRSGSSRGNNYTLDRLSFTQITQAVPEPSTLLLLGSGLAGLAFLRKRLGRREG